MTIGILGGGQLGQMLAQAAAELDHTCIFFDPNPDACAQSEGTLIVGTYDDHAAIDVFAKQCDVITYEFENIPVETVAHLEQSSTVYPSSAVLAATQDRFDEKSLCTELDIAVGAYANVPTADVLDAVLESFAWQAVLKTRRFGYDGKGQVVVQSKEDISAAKELVEAQVCIAEKLILFDRELSQIATRSPAGDIAFYPLVHNVHTNGILHISRVPVEVDAEKIQQAQHIARTLLEHFDYVGTIAIELFDTADGLLLNEIAPRVHNSGHWSIEGAQTSQFSNHIRAITGQPLGVTDVRDHVAMVNVIGTHLSDTAADQTDDVFVHTYGKAERPGRKLGHVTVMNEDVNVVEKHVANIVGDQT